LFAMPPSSGPPPPLQPTNPPASIQISRAKIPPSASLPRRLLATRDDALWKASPPSDAGLDPVLPLQEGHTSGSYPPSPEKRAGEGGGGAPHRAAVGGPLEQRARDEMDRDATRERRGRTPWRLARAPPHRALELCRGSRLSE
jgi:hypothetical protein